MIMTAHAMRRCMQRRIPEHLLDFVVDMGTKTKKPGGAALMSIGKKDIDMAIHECKAVIQDLERLKRQKVSIVVAGDNETVITAYRQR